MILRAGFRVAIEMAERVRVFVEAHPSDDPGLAPLTEALTRLLGRATELIALHDDNRTKVTAAVSRRAELRKSAVTGLLQLIARTGQSAARQDPAVAGRFRTVRVSGPALVFVRSAEALVAAAREHREVLAAHGLSDGVVDQAAALLQQYDVVGDEQAAAVQGRVQARAELSVVTRQLKVTVRQLDAFNKHRFAKDDELLAAWKTARNLIGPASRSSGGDPTPVSGTGGDGGTVPPPAETTGEATDVA
ncbi:MAG: hypothetical protein AB7R55_05355 [Gemmatimonadales bacterium]